MTAQCPTDKVNDPVLYPGWRGQKDNWEEMGLNYGSSTPATNLAIKGLFEIVSEEEAASLESQDIPKLIGVLIWLIIEMNMISICFGIMITFRLLSICGRLLLM